MPEWLPVALSFCLGGCLRLPVNPPLRAALAGTGILLLASGAFIISGELGVSWTYFFQDLIQVSMGFLAGVVALHSVSRAPDFWGTR